MKKANMYYGGTQKTAAAIVVFVLLVGAELLAQRQTWRTGWDTHNTAGKEAYRQGNYAASIPEFRAAVREAEKDSGKDAKQCLAASLTNLGEAYTETRQYGSAAAVLTRAAELWRTTAGPSDVNYAIALRDLAILRQDQKQYTEAERLFRHGLSITQRAFGEQHRSTTMLMNDLGMLYREEGKHPAATEMFQKAMKLDEARGSDGQLTLPPTPIILPNCIFRRSATAKQRLSIRELSRSASLN